MASNRGLSLGVDWQDTASAWDAFEETNRVRVSLRISNAGAGVVPDLWLLMEAHERGEATGEAPALVSVSARAGSLNLRTLEAAILYLLYQVDFQLGERELKITAK